MLLSQEIHADGVLLGRHLMTMNVGRCFLLRYSGLHSLTVHDDAWTSVSSGDPGYTDAALTYRFVTNKRCRPRGLVPGSASERAIANLVSEIPDKGRQAARYAPRASSPIRRDVVGDS